MGSAAELRIFTEMIDSADKLGVSGMNVKLPAEPEAIQFDPRSSAVVVIDMQNYDVSPGGYFDLTGVDTTHGRNVVQPIKHLIEGARRANVPVIYTRNIVPRDPLRRPSEESPWYWKSGRRAEEASPELQRAAGIEGNWGAEIVDDLAPMPGDLVVDKTTYSAFVHTGFDQLLRRRGVRTLFITGIGTPTCVDATARDAYFHEYWAVVVSDCCGAILPETHEQALFHIKRRYGWVTTSPDVLVALALEEPEP